MNNKKGFTLMEVLTVVIIVGILAAIALPRYGKITERARFTKAQIMAKALHDSCERYVSEWGVEELSAIPEASRKLSRMDIGSTDLLPTGFSMSDTHNSIAGAGFMYYLKEGENCVVRITKQINSKVITIDYDGENLTCSGDEDQCDIYGVEYVN